MGIVVLRFIVLFLMLMGLPMIGIIAAGYPIHRYLEFPPATRYISHAPFSWTAFVLYSVFILAVVSPFVFNWSKTPKAEKTRHSVFPPFPWWGWFGIAFGICIWVLAWTRFDWFKPFQPHTFTPLWISYILVVNALSFRRSGRCMLIHRPGFFLLLFPLSAAFWWFFEYLNRYVQNWHYSGATYEPLTYFTLATLSFSTVLPAVLGTRAWLSGISLLNRPFERLRPLNFSQPRLVAGTVLFFSGLGLLGIGVAPDILFPLMWVSPLLIVVSLQVLFNQVHVFSDVRNGDWRRVVTAALSALICGGFWEMWNFYSLARWEYTVPLVHRFQIFEMPLLGFAGYLPFGLECLAVSEMMTSHSETLHP